MTNGRASAAGIWHVAAANSTLWRALEPLRRVSTVVERLVANATRADAPADRDRRAEAVFNSSWLVVAADRVVDRVSRAWRHSIVRRYGDAMIEPFAASPLEARLRLAAAIVAVGSGTALVLRLLTSRPDRFTWIVPATSLAVAAMVVVGARAIADAMERRR
jgi:hypothetical protein